MNKNSALDSFLIDDKVNELKFSEPLYGRRTIPYAAVFFVLMLIASYGNVGVFLFCLLPLYFVSEVLFSRSVYHIDLDSGLLEERLVKFGITIKRSVIDLKEYVGIAKMRFSGYKEVSSLSLLVGLGAITGRFSSQKQIGYRIVILKEGHLKRYELETVGEHDDVDDLMEKWSRKLSLPIVVFSPKVRRRRR